MGRVAAPLTPQPVSDREAGAARRPVLRRVIDVEPLRCPRCGGSMLLEPTSDPGAAFIYECPHCGHEQATRLTWKDVEQLLPPPIAPERPGTLSPGEARSKPKESAAAAARRVRHRWQARRYTLRQRAEAGSQGAAAALAALLTVRPATPPSAAQTWWRERFDADLATKTLAPSMLRVALLRGAAWSAEEIAAETGYGHRTVATLLSAAKRRMEREERA